MKSRRDFIRIAAISSATAFVGKILANPTENLKFPKTNFNAPGPMVVSTWEHGIEANRAAWKILSNGGMAIDAVEKGVKVTESDPLITSVGLGGLPDRDGKVTLDACIMDHQSNCGAVAFLENIENPISVARKVMENTPHVMLVGKGAQDFALESGFKKVNLLTENAKKEWEAWKMSSKYKSVINIENHDTIGMLAIDGNGNLAGACTTSGMAYKMHGRVGDSPIIGAGLFVDNEIGAACATGMGEAVIRIAGSSIVVELMRQGHSPQKACEEAVKRIIQKHKNLENLQVGFLAINKSGEVGAFSVYEGFNYAVTSRDIDILKNAKYVKKLVE
ncbi:isoaspartyl peptidase/L-asparaginase family protein [Namhaeicola litoreus]|uniref:Isoaspartyl peptidase/L-asparaginase family protein n=1 Tax=Namhaeicola litoreus TaxID=1052145 RepID=A0ABW3Y3V9_9FLAO